MGRVLAKIGFVLSLCSGTVLADAPRFERDVLPIFTANCLSCHGGTSVYTQSGLDLRTAAATFKGSYNGPVVVKGSPEKSVLYQQVANKLMPPPAFKLTLTAEQIETIRRWIEGGALSDQPLAGSDDLAAEQARFEKEALPILSSRCFSCHGNDKPMAGLDLRTLASVLKGSANGPVVVEGASDKSILIRKVASRSMPPPGMGEPLSETQIGALRGWIDKAHFSSPSAQSPTLRTTFSAAEAPEITSKDREFWSFRKPIAQAVPKVKNRDRVRTPIDAFVLAKLEAKGLTFSPDAPNLTLMRRAYFDLIGLPPTPEEVRQFLADTRPGAYERLVDRLLASPHYGERWGRYWLDAAGYSDSAGFDNILETHEIMTGMWRYRDYVVQSFNNDKPYDRFLTEQLAGDELVDWRSAKKYTPQMVDSLVATGYLRNVYDRTSMDIVNLAGERYDVLFHLMEKVSTSVLGLTVGCARCHSHKFDPIPQRDYYRFLSIFTAAYNPVNWAQPKNRYLPDVSKPDQEEIARHNAEIDPPLNELRKELAGLRRPYEERLLEEKLSVVPEEIRADTRNALETPEDKRDAVQKFLAQKLGNKLKVTSKEVERILQEPDKTKSHELEEKIADWVRLQRSFQNIPALWETGPPPTMRLLQRGSVESPGPKVEPGLLTVLSAPGKTDITRPPDAVGPTSGYRLALAHWLTDPEHPLTARVMVNRVWQQHFGTGIVATPENFGHMGVPPTHPELLDWLAVNFMENGWTLKRVHRMIMTSTTYRQMSVQPSDGQASMAKTVDPENHLLWRMNLIRLDAEAIRDTILAASGKLDRTVGGPPVLLKARPDGLQTINEDSTIPNAKWRRSLYVLARRVFPMDFLSVFDYPIMQTNCTRRINSATPLQALTMLNDEFLVDNARDLAERVNATAGGNLTRKIEAAYLLALARKPTEIELRMGESHLKKEEDLYAKGNFPADRASRSALASLCQMLLSANEFLFVD